MANQKNLGALSFYDKLIVLDQLLFDKMIACRLSTILGAKRLKVSDVCRGTGIARATLDRYYNDRVNSFDREVLGKLCDFLQIMPGDLLVVVEQGVLFNTAYEAALGSSAYPVTVETIFDGNSILREP